MLDTRDIAYDVLSCFLLAFNDVSLMQMTILYSLGSIFY